MDYEKKTSLLLLYYFIWLASIVPGYCLDDPIVSSDVPRAGFNSGEVVGRCNVAGNVRSFQIDCTQEIRNFTVGFITAGSTMRVASVINGVQYDTNISNTGMSLVGTEGFVSNLAITIRFTDDTTAFVTLRH